MTTQIKTLRENIIKAISGIKDDNVSIAGVAIDRKTLLAALKIQTADTVTIQYGKMSWIDGHFGEDNYDKTKWYDHSLEPENALQIICDRTIMRFLNRATVARRGETKTSSLAFIDHKTESIKPVTGIPLDTRELLEALTYVIPCVAVEESRFVLRCVCFDVKNEVLTLAAADGFRLGIAKLPVKSIPDMRIIVHANDINRLVTFLKSIKPETTGSKGIMASITSKQGLSARLAAYTGKRVNTFKNYSTIQLQREWDDIIDKDKQGMIDAVSRAQNIYRMGSARPEVYMSVAEKEIAFAVQGKSIELPLQVGTFPDYDKLIPTEGTKVEFIASDLYEAVQVVAPYSRDGSGIVRLQATINDVIKVSARSEELGESVSEVAAKVQADCRIASNCKYLTDLLRMCGDNKVTLKITTPSSPMVFETSENRLCVVMPMFVQWGQADTKPEPKPEIEEIETPEDELEPYETDDSNLVETEAM